MNISHGNTLLPTFNKVLFFFLIKMMIFALSIHLEAMQKARLLLLLSCGTSAKAFLQ